MYMCSSVKMNILSDSVITYKVLTVFQFLLLKNTINTFTVKVLCLLLPSSIFVVLVDCIT